MSLKRIKQAQTLDDLAEACFNAAKTIRQDINGLTQELALSISRRLIYETPVDTSAALSNWQVSVNYAPKNVLLPHFKGEDGSTYEQSTSIAVMSAYGEIRARQFGQTIHITNNAKHIVELNQGKSFQADAHYIESIIEKEYAAAIVKLRNYANGN